MRDLPDGPTLADFARQASARGESGDLVLRALAIAEREVIAGSTPLENCQAILADHYGEGDVSTLLHQLSNDIRAGAFDAPGPARDWALRLLWAITVQKLRESNPEYLAAATG